MLCCGMLCFAGCLDTVEPAVHVDSLYLLVRWWCEHRATFTTLRWLCICGHSKMNVNTLDVTINELMLVTWQKTLTVSSVILFFLVFYLCNLQESPGPWWPLSLHQWDYLLWTWPARSRSSRWTSNCPAGQQHYVWPEGEGPCDNITWTFYP